MDNFIITTGGRKVELQPVAQRDIEKVVAVVEREFKARGEPLEPPWYYSIEPDEKGEGGEKVFWDTASVAKDGNEEEKAAWAKHQEATNRLAKAREERATEIMLLKGIKNEEDKRPTPEWIKEQQYWGIELPSEPRKLALEYIQSEVLKTPFDLINATKKVVLLNLNGVVKDEEIAAVEATFQDALAEAAQLFIHQNLGGITSRNGRSGAVEMGGVELLNGKEGLASGEILGAEVSERVG
jgi:hypothetical protein